VAARDRLEVTVERVELTVQPVELDQHRAQRGVRELVVEALAGDPRSVHLGPLQSGRRGRSGRA
jgi:hypothetical protein